MRCNDLSLYYASLEAEYENIGKTRNLFSVEKKSYGQQYSQIYYVRLASLHPILMAKATRKWAALNGSLVDVQIMYSFLIAAICDRIIDLTPKRLSCVIGTMYVDMEMKPNVLKDLAADLSILKPEPKPKYIDGNVEFFLEDESARMCLKLSRAQLNLATGVSAAFLGMENEDGDFEVQDVCFAEIDEKRAFNTSSLNDNVGLISKPYIAIISGTQFSSHSGIEFELLQDFLNSKVCFPEIADKIGRVIFAGNSIINPRRIDEVSKKKYGVEHARYDFRDYLNFDTILNSLCQNIPIDLMPGQDDPTNVSIPQSPIHPRLFKTASKLSSFQPTTNPYSFNYNGLRFLGTSGQNIDDIYRFSFMDNRLDIAECILRWRNIAPTAPDTLWCFPFYDRDPFVITETPDVLFIGNQPNFEFRKIQREDGTHVLIVLIPKFSENPCVVLINTQEVSCECIKLMH